MTDTIEQVNATTVGEPGNRIRVTIDAGYHIACRIIFAGDKESRLLDFVGRIGAKLLHVDILRAVAIERTAKSAADETLCVIGDILAGEPGWQWVRIGKPVQKRRGASGPDQRVDALRPVAGQRVVEQADGAVWVGFELGLGGTWKPEVCLIKNLVRVRVSPELRWLAVNIICRRNRQSDDGSNFTGVDEGGDRKG